ncbi:MAG TPA: hypothetical protein VEF89_21855 [Solirubrobacteraceae bacterium]|nr:hypothetical protein [Solirubrobacteraceae bacterium]
MARRRHQEDWKLPAHAIGSAQEHLAAELELLEAEKDLTRRGDIAVD